MVKRCPKRYAQEIRNIYDGKCYATHCLFGPTDSVDGSPNYRPSTRVQESCAIIFSIVRMGDYILLQSQNDCLELKFGNSQKLM